MGGLGKWREQNRETRGSLLTTLKYRSREDVRPEVNPNRVLGWLFSPTLVNEMKRNDETTVLTPSLTQGEVNTKIVSQEKVPGVRSLGGSEVQQGHRESGNLAGVEGL